MFKNLLVASMLALSSCAFYTNVCDCESVPEERQEKLNKLLISTLNNVKNPHNFELVEFLVSEGADIKSIANMNIGGTEKEPIYPLFWAMLGGDDFRLAELLIKNGADINKCKYNTQCMEMMAIFPDRKGTKLLIDNGANVNYINKEGESVLDTFAKYNMKRKSLSDEDKEVLQMLINAGAKLNKYKDDKEVKAFLGIE